MLAGIQRLAVLFSGLGDDDVGQIQYGLDTAVVFFQTDNAAARKYFRKLHDIFEAGPAEAIDALRIVSDDHHIVLRTRQQAHDCGLHVIGVLIFIDRFAEHVGQGMPAGKRSIAGGDARLFAQHVDQFFAVGTTDNGERGIQTDAAGTPSSARRATR